MYRLAVKGELSPDECFRQVPLFTCTITLCTREAMTRTVREAFDRRRVNHYVSVLHRPPGRVAHRLEGCRLTSWLSGPDTPQRVGLTITNPDSEHNFTIPVEEIDEFTVDWYNKSNVET